GVVLVVTAVHRPRALARLPERVLLARHRPQLGEDVCARPTALGKLRVHLVTTLVAICAHRLLLSRSAPGGSAAAPRRRPRTARAGDRRGGGGRRWARRGPWSSPGPPRPRGRARHAAVAPPGRLHARPPRPGSRARRPAGPARRPGSAPIRASGPLHRRTRA